HAPNASARIFFGTDARMQGLLAGALLAIAHASGVLDRLPRRAVVRAGAVGAAFLLAVALVLPGAAVPRALGGLTAFALAGAALVAAIVVGGQFRLLESAPMRWLGRRSYALSLCHAHIAHRQVSRG